MKKRLHIIYFSVALIFCIAFNNSCKRANENNDTVITKNKLTGLVQKGPYSEASISLYELNNQLQATGKIIYSGIYGKDGSFGFENLALISPYAELKANGYYFNEVSGLISSYHLTLTALSDLNDRSSVNINLLTHLETRRVKYLVENGVPFAAAKDTAQKEILSIFGLGTMPPCKSESLDISADDEGDAILLAISVILQGNKSVRELTEFLNILCEDIKQDGKLENDSIPGELRNTVLNLNLENIRENLESRYNSLGISVSIPDFENYVQEFLAYTGKPPSVKTLNATSITASGAILHGSASANDITTIISFEYGLSSQYGKEIYAFPGTISGHTDYSITSQLMNLDPGTLYHFRIKASNSRGVTVGEDMSFTTSNKSSIRDIKTGIFISGSSESSKDFNTVFLKARENLENKDSLACSFNTESVVRNTVYKSHQVAKIDVSAALGKKETNNLNWYEKMESRIQLNPWEDIVHQL